jgi:DEAD/DEAH box helicase domain-containing protein
MRKEDLVNNFPDYRSQLSHIEEISSRDSEIVEPDIHLPLEISKNFPFDGLYSHQAQSLWEIGAGNNLCITTETSSGKTLVYALAIARKKINQGSVSALLVYPTKALSRDQEKEMNKLYNQIGLDIDIGVYDGDTSRDEKKRIRRESDVVITNLQGLNHYIPHHRKWESIFNSLDFFVIDEAHTYTGISGMHSSWIIRRFLRVVNRSYNTSPQIIISSATIGNPREHSRNLTGENFVVVDEDGSPRGKQDIIFWNPPSYEDENGINRRRSSHRESAKVTSHLASKGYQTLCFCPSRKLTELVSKWAEEFIEENYDKDITIESYNAGYNKQERREIENKFKDGQIDALISTNALEVGIDIGSIDCTVLDTYPGSRTSFFQQIGRSGRGESQSLSVMVTDNSAINQFLINNPNYLFSENLDKCVVDLDNKNVMMKHVLAASNELTLDKRDINYFGEELDEVVSVLKAKNLIQGESLSKGYHYKGEGRPTSDISIYTTTDEKYEIRIVKNDEIKKTLPEESKERVYRDFHPGAIHLHRGKKYKVKTLNNEDRYVELEPTDANYTTVSNSEVEISEVKEQRKANIGQSTVHMGTATVRESFDTYKKIYDDNSEMESGLSTGINDSYEIRTHIMWIDPPEINPIMGGMHAAEHAIIKMSPSVLRIDSRDVGGLSVSSHPINNGEPTIFIYDGVSGGVGFSHSIFNNIREIANRTYKRLDNCSCDSESGCPACTMSSSCGDDNEPLNKEGAIKILQNLK